MTKLMTKKEFHDAMRAYAAIHQHPLNRACHMIGIPMIALSLPVIPIAPPVGLGMFGTGWAIQFLGHWFEGKKPEFGNKPINLVLGPIWVGVEWVELLTGKRLYELPTEDAVAA